jgi:hypothetical protein
LFIRSENLVEPSNSVLDVLAGGQDGEVLLTAGADGFLERDLVEQVIAEAR